jgi:D-cysteine desulfhydrase
MHRAPLGVWRTPLEPAPRLAERLGLRPGDLLVKRDDWLGHGGGGNKLRKLEYLCGEAMAAGATTLVTTGAGQSNYCRLTAAAARRLGLGVVLVLRGHGPREGTTGNLALDGLFGAEIRWAGDAAMEDLDAIAGDVADELRARGDRPAVLPLGGTDAVGARGYLDCAAELREQAPDARHVVCAVGSAGTMAGLVAGLGPERVLGVDAGAVPDARERVSRLAAELGAGPGAPLRWRADQVGAGYEQPTEASVRAMEDAARCEGIALDPVYTAKAMAGLAAAVAGGEIRPGEQTVFVHTGGLPGFFGHPLAAHFAQATAAGP